jgi:osmotically-inducible protein OsmY
MNFKTLLATLSVAAILTSCTSSYETQRQRDIDNTVSNNVVDKLRVDSTLNVYPINVKVSGGNVELSGTVDTHAEAARAEADALSINGVRSVRNDLYVRNLISEPKLNTTSVTRESKDTIITAAVKLALLNNAAIDSTNISVTTRNGVVYLTGITPTHGEASQAGHVALKVKGVKRVYNQIMVE